MKKILTLLFLLFYIFSFSQNKNFTQPFPSFEKCNESQNKNECFDDTIAKIITSSISKDAKRYFKDYSDCDSLSVFVSFVIGEKGIIIKESIRVSKFKNTNIEKELNNAIQKFPKIHPVKNEYNHDILYYYQLYINLAIDENGKLVILNKSDELINSSIEDGFISPIYSGCKPTSNSDLKTCFSKKITHLILKKFKIQKALKGFNKKGTFNIYVLFSVNKEGEINDFTAYGSSKNMSNEALRSLKRIKGLQPGINKGKTVRVPYSLPIKFKIE